MTVSSISHGIADLLVSPSDDGSIFIWSIPSGELVAVLQSEAVSHTEDHHALCAVAAHPAMLRLASAGTDGIIRTWSPEVSGGFIFTMFSMRE